MQIHIITGSSSAIYRQIADQVRQGVVTGKLAVGDAMPSVRQLAKDLVINPNTVAKAYAELVRDGVLESQQGRGVFVAARRNVFSKAERNRRLDLALDTALSEALDIGFCARGDLAADAFAIGQVERHGKVAEESESRTMSLDMVIRTHGLTRYFGGRAVVRNLNFAVPRGSVVALLGLNGAGKTTTLRMLLGLLAPTRGRAEVLGRDSQQLRPEDRARIGFTGEGHFLYGWMRVREVESFGRQTFPRWNPALFHEIVDRFEIDVAARVRWLSRGQRAGVSLASTLGSHPELLILDDPALGLDPVSRRALNETIVDFCDSGQPQRSTQHASTGRCGADCRSRRGDGAGEFAGRYHDGQSARARGGMECEYAHGPGTRPSNPEINSQSATRRTMGGHGVRPGRR